MKAIRISDTELVDIDPNSEADVKEATADLNPNVPTLPPQPASDVEAYRLAFDAGDIDELERLRAKHPEDARYNLHLQVLEIKPEQTQEFSEVKKQHETMLKSIGMDGLAEFHRITETGNKTKAQNFVDKLRKDHPLKSAMQTMVDFME